MEALSTEQRNILEEIYFELAAEASDEFPLTVPESSVLKASLKLSTELTDDFEQRPEGRYDLTEIAAQLLFRDKGLYPEKRGVLAVRSWQMTQCEYARYSMDVGAKSPVRFSFRTVYVPVGSPVDSLEKLPPEFQTKLRDEYNRLARMTPSEVYKLVYDEGD